MILSLIITFIIVICLYIAFANEEQREKYFRMLLILVVEIIVLGLIMYIYFGGFSCV